MDSSVSLFGQVHLQSKGSLLCSLELPFIRGTPVFDTNNADPDQRLHSMASDAWSKLALLEFPDLNGLISLICNFAEVEIRFSKAPV